MKTYRIEKFEAWETIMVKTTEQMKEWIKKFNVTGKNGEPVDLRKAHDGMVVRANGKLLRITQR